MMDPLRQPAIVIARPVGGGSSFGPVSVVPTGIALLVEGMDAYPAIQPNNGDLVVQNSTSGAVLWQVQQSQNFPGPFAWRGTLPLFTLDEIFVSASVGFNFVMWGTFVPDFTVDVQLPD